MGCEVVGCGTKDVQFMNEQSIPIFMFTLPVIQRACVPWSSRCGRRRPLRPNSARARQAGRGQEVHTYTLNVPT